MSEQDIFAQEGVLERNARRVVGITFELRGILDGIQAMPFPAMQSMLGPSFPDGNQNYWKSTLQQELADGAISAIVEHANSLQSALSFVVLEYYGEAAGGSRRRRPHSRIAICLGIFSLSRSGPIWRKRARTAIGPGPVKRSCGLSRRGTLTFAPRSMSSRKTSSRGHSAGTYLVWPLSESIPLTSSA